MEKGMKIGNYVPRVKFAHNWNGKLDAEYFSTIREWNPEKQAHYEGHIGDKFEAILRGSLYRHGRLLSANCSYKLKDLPRELLILDTGTEDYLPVFEKFGVTLESRIILLLFHSLDKPGIQAGSQPQEKPGNILREKPASQTTPPGSRRL